MKTVEKLAAGWLVTLGFMFLAVSVSEIIDRSAKFVKIYPIEDEVVFTSPHATQDSNDTILGGIIFGGPTIILGTWLSLELYLQSRRDKKMISQQKNDYLQGQFYQILQQNHGKLTLLNFAMQSQLPPSEAKEYLDQKAKEFNANFQVNEEGGVSYYFDI